MIALTLAAACGLAGLTVDGRITDAEWAGAAMHRIEGATVWIARDGDALCVAVRSDEGLRYADVYLVGPEGEIVNLHASMQAGVRRLSRDGGWDDWNPDFTWGNPQGWRASTVGWVRGVPEDRPLEERMTPYDGQEFEIDLSAFGPGPWRIRVEASDFRNPPGPKRVWPEEADRLDVVTWAVLD